MTTSETKEWTWQEISKHNSYESCWIYVETDVYDITQWIPRHPGGEELLLLFSGRDCTQAFRSYHPFTDKPYDILEKYKIGKLKGPSESIKWRDDTGFYKTVRERCAQYFKEHNIDPVKQTFLYEIYRFGSSIGVILVGFYVFLKLFRDWNIPVFFRLLSCFLIGLAGVMIAVNISHMASHVPTFHCPKLNYLLGWFSFDCCLGLSFDIWLHEHVVGHHQYTNVISIDPNAPEGHGDDALFRSSPHQNWYQRFYYQFIWLPLISFLLVTEYRVASFRYWFKGFRKEIRVSERFLGPRSVFLFITGKIIYFFRMYYLPIFWWNVPVWETLAAVIISEMVAGYFTGITFPANHITDKVLWPLIKVDKETGAQTIDAEWAIAQVQTCKDYSYESWIFTNVFGSLNNHSCHHLFPAMHHSHYQKIYPIVKQTAKEYNVALPDVGNYFELIYDYVHNLYEMGFDPKKSM